jgi:hypothetical protein
MGAVKSRKPKADSRQPPTERDLEIDAAMWHALAKHAAKQADREQLRAGQTYDVKIDLCGHIAGRWRHAELGGVLTVDHDQTQARSSACDQAHLVAVLLEALPATRRRALLADLPQRYLETKELPPVEDATLSAAELLLGKLRTAEPSLRKGNVSFRPAA